MEEGIKQRRPGILAGGAEWRGIFGHIIVDCHWCHVLLHYHDITAIKPQTSVIKVDKVSSDNGMIW